MTKFKTEHGTIFFHNEFLQCSRFFLFFPFRVIFGFWHDFPEIAEKSRLNGYLK